VSDTVRDEGSMLVEMLVGMVLMSIVGMLVLQGIVDGFRSHRSEALAEVRTAAERLARDIRGANPVLSATSTQLQIRRYAPNGDSVRMVWEIVTLGGVRKLQKSVFTTPVGSTTEGPAVTTVALDKLTPGVDPFTYYPVTNFAVPSGSTVNAATCEISTLPGQYAPTCIGEVFLHVSRTVNGHTPVVVDAEIDLRNQT
jgi:type II secretory pathway pseudopilin PulG